MEAATLPSKKTVNKGKIKKTLKNVLCRPDPVFWPSVSDTQKKRVETALSKYQVEIPEFKKPHWKDLKLIPKDKRPKQPKIKRIEGLFFGVSECCNAIRDNCCVGVIVESTVNPRAIVQPAIEACINSKVPVICVSGLRAMSASNFGIPTSCLGIKCDCVPDLRTEVTDIAKVFTLPRIPNTVSTESIDMNDESKEFDLSPKIEPVSTTCPYLNRTNKNTRVFNPSDAPIRDNLNKNFSGQDFIEFGVKKDSLKAASIDRQSYMKMVLKKISNNPKRLKLNK